MNSLEKKNIRKYYLRYVLYYCANTLITGGLLQSFMLENGISSGRVSFYTALIQIVQAAAMLLLGPVLEQRKDIIRTNANANFALFPLMAVILLICLVPMSVDLRYLLLVVSGCIAYLAFAVIGILEYKLPYRIIRMEHYGTVVSLAGAFIGLSSLLTSSLFSFCLRFSDYPKVMAVFISIGAVCLFFSTLVGRSYRELPDGETEEEKTASADNKRKNGDSIFRYGPFRKLFLPNLIRGFSSGTFALMTTVGYHYSILTAEGAGVMVALSNVIIMACCVLYSRLARKKIDGILILGSSAALCLILPAMLLGQSSAVFIGFYVAGAFFKNIIDYACPVVCAKLVDYEHVGQFSSWRIALYMLGAALSGFVTIPMLEAFGGVWTMLVNGILFVLMGFGYWKSERDLSRSPEPEDAV